MNSLGHLILFLEHLNALNALASKQTSKQSLHPRHCCLCGWNLYEISLPQGEKLNMTRATLKPSGGYPFTGWESGQMCLVPKEVLPPLRSHPVSLTPQPTPRACLPFSLGNHFGSDNTGPSIKIQSSWIPWVGIKCWMSSIEPIL